MTVTAAPLAPELSLAGDTLSLRGPMTLGHARALELAGAQTLPGGTVIADLSAVAAIDSSALAVLLSWQRVQQQQGGLLAVRAAPEALLSLARVYGVDDQLAWV